jgi:SAM-dependent methyltransferase
MNLFLNGVARATAEAFDLPGPILEIGSYQVEGQQDLINLRPFFPNREYVGVDVRPGPGVDSVADVERLPYANGSVGTVIAMSAFEHVPRFWRGFDEVQRVLRPDGVFLVSCPFYFHIHAYPCDYWRFTPEAFDFLLQPYPTRILGWHGPKRRPANVWAIGFGEEAPPVLPQRVAIYRSLLDEYARQPISWTKELRYRLGRWIGGRRAFAPFLERERWEIVCRSRSTSRSASRTGTVADYYATV